MLAPFEDPKQDLGGNIVGQVTRQLNFLPGQNFRKLNFKNIVLNLM